MNNFKELFLTIVALFATVGAVVAMCPSHTFNAKSEIASVDTYLHHSISTPDYVPTSQVNDDEFHIVGHDFQTYFSVGRMQ